MKRVKPNQKVTWHNNIETCVVVSVDGEFISIRWEGAGTLVYAAETVNAWVK